MKSITTRVLNAFPERIALTADEIAVQIDAPAGEVIKALHELQDANLVRLRNGFYRLSRLGGAVIASAKGDGS